MLKKLALTACAVLAVSAAATDVRADESNSAIVHRQGVFKVASGHMSGLKSILLLKDGPTANLSYHAEGILAAFQHLGNAWPEGSDKGETKAKSDIWTARAKFDEAGKKAYNASLALVEAAKTGPGEQSVAAFKALGGTCKACHEDFKKD